MIVLAGASASGKTEVAKTLMKKYGIKKVITTTTREMRAGEKNGVDYFFVSKRQFEKMVRTGAFVEYTIFNGNYYGSTKDQISDDKCIVIDPAGLRSYIALGNKTVVTFYLESSENLRIKRMYERGDKPEKIEERIANDREIFLSELLPTTDFVINSDEKHSVENISDEVYKLYNQFLSGK